VPNSRYDERLRNRKVMTEKPPVVLTIAGFDPSSGAGVTADIKTIAAHGCYGVSCITAMTVQSTAGVKRVEAVDPALVTDTLQELVADLEIAAVHIGMLGTGKVVKAVADFLKPIGSDNGRLPNIVLDPILTSSSGADLLDGAAPHFDRFYRRIGRPPIAHDRLADLLPLPGPGPRGGLVEARQRGLRQLLIVQGAGQHILQDPRPRLAHLHGDFGRRCGPGAVIADPGGTCLHLLRVAQGAGGEQHQQQEHDREATEDAAAYGECEQP